MDLLQLFDETIWSRTLFGVPGYVWLMLLAVWAGFSLGFVLVRRFVNWRLGALARRTRTEIDDVIAEIVRRTRTFFLIVLALYAAVEVVSVSDVVEEVVGRLAFLALLLQVVLWGNRLITLWIERYRAHRLEQDAAAVTSMQAVGVLGRIVLWALVLLLALDNFGVEVTALVAGLGVGGIAVALAVQSILGDLFASLSIVLDKPFVVGDFLILDNYMGTVEAIGLKTTRLRSLSGEQIIVSNGDLLKSRIRNYKRMFERRIVFSIGVVYETPVEQVAAIPGMLREIVEAQDRVRFDRAHFQSYGDFALNYEVVYYVLDSDFNLYMDIQQAINLAIFRRFADEGIAFAYPTQTLYMGRSEEAPNDAVAERPAA